MPITDELPPPRAGRPSLFDFVGAHLGADGFDGPALPDEDEGVRLRWAPGAMDGVATHHFGIREDPDRVAIVERLLRVALDDPAPAKLDGLYTVLAESDVLSVIDPLLSRLRDDPPPASALEEVARWLVTRAPDRAPVKIGVALLGLVLQPAHRPLLDRLGRHDEFTLFVAVAYANALPDPEPALFALAREVHGWGRVHLVERLAQTGDPEIRRWLLREGFRNRVMDEYLALDCAIGGALHEALGEPDVDDALMEGARDLLGSLCRGGPAGDLAHYEQGPEAVQAWLRHLDGRPPDVADLAVMAALREWVDDHTAEEGWTTFVRARTARDLDARIGDERWRDVVEAGLRSEDPVVRWSAGRCVDLVGIDAWPIWLAHLQRGVDTWQEALDTDDVERFERVLAVAEARTDLDALATGPADDLGVGPASEPYWVLEAVVGAAERFPGRASGFVLAGLACPVVRIRHRALSVLDAWGPDRWPAGARDRLAAILPREVDDRVRAGMQALLAGRRLPHDEGEE